MLDQDREQRPLLDIKRNSLRKLEKEKWDQEQKVTLSRVIALTFDLQKQYGKTAEQLQNIVEGYSWAMQNYAVEDVIYGIKKYLLKHSDIPTPADIVKIIDPQPEPWKPDFSLYNRYKKLREEQGPYALSQDEADYMAAYEEYNLGKRPKSS